MPRAALWRVDDEASGLRFYFAFDRNETDRLHVDVRGTSPQEAIDTYFEATTTVWNPEHNRHESTSDTHGIFWAYYAGRQEWIMIISCFWLELGG